MTEDEHARLVQSARRGEVRWVDLALQERAHLGMIHPETWDRMTPGEQRDMGKMNQTTARQRLGLLKPIGKAVGQR